MAARKSSALKLRELWAFGADAPARAAGTLCGGLDSETVVSSCIRSLRSLEIVSWRDFVESVSAVEEILRHDPAGIYARMDFETHDVYRHQLEKLAA